MPGPPDSLLDRIAQPAPDAVPPSPDPPLFSAPADRAGWRLFATIAGLAIAGVTAPTAVTALTGSNVLPGSPLLAGALAGLLVLAPAAVGLLTAITGWRRAVSRAARAGSEAELAVLRVLVDTLLFGYALAVAATGASPDGAADCLGVAAVALIVAWALLLCVMLWPQAPRLRRNGALALDAVLISTFLHFGGGAVAGWYPFYFLLILYAGFCLGLDALAVGATAGTIGFAAVILSTEFWRVQPALAGGLLVALAVLPGCFAGMLRALAVARARASGAEAERQTTLRLIADSLRSPPAAQHGTGGMSPAIGDLLDFAALEAGTFALAIETFELRQLINDSLIPLQEKAAERGIALRWRVDARLPRRLRGHAQAVARIAGALAEHAIEAASTAMVRLTVAGAASNAKRLHLVLWVDGLAPLPDGRLPGDGGELPLRLVERLARMVGGVIERHPGRRDRLAVMLPLAIEEGAQARALDLAGLPIVIVTEDEALAGALAETLAMWGAVLSWRDDIDTALHEFGSEAAARPVLIVDGRDKLLSALSLAHRAAQLGAGAPFVVLIAAEDRIAGLGEVEEAGIDGLLPAPITAALLANAIEALPLPRRKTALPPAAEPLLRPPAAPDEAAPAAGERITPIAAHPKFAIETAAVVDARVVEGLRELGDGPGFLGELIETFRTDARQIMQRLAAAAAAADAAGFTRGVAALQRAGGPLGGTQLCELLASLQGLTAAELRLRGTAHAQRLEAEIERLVAALREFLPSSEARQG